MRTIKQIQKEIKKGLNLKKSNKKVHFEEPIETEIQKAINIKKKLKKIYKDEAEKKLNDEIEKQRAFEPITKGLKNVEEAVRKTDNDITKFLVPVSSLTQTSDFIDKQKKLITQRGITNTPTRDNQTQTNHSSIYLGDIASRFLAKAEDKKFGIYYESNTNKHMIGKCEIHIKDNDIILNNKTYKGTQGLWRLLAYPQAIESNLYNPQDFDTYKEILLNTDSIYQNNDKTTRKPKSSSGSKYKTFIAPLWKEICENKSPLEHEGSGLINYTENPIQYKYIDNLNELLKRLYFIAAEEGAGNNNFHNEKLSIINFVTKEMENLIDTPRGIEYLISFIAGLPKKVIRGSGFVNNLLNSKIIPELHVPGYNYLGPYTKSMKKKPINKLDEAAMQHDFYYEKHKDTKSRHKADLILENTAKDIYRDPETPLEEKTVAFVTSNIMHLKRKLGMGLI